MNLAKFKSIFQKVFKPGFNYNDYKELSDACTLGDLDTVSYLLENKKSRFIKLSVEDVFNNLCRNGHLHIIKYLLTSPNLKDFHDTHTKYTSWIAPTCQRGYLDIIQYLFTSPELKNHPDIHTNNDVALRSACEFYQFNIVDFLISSQDFKKNLNLHAEKDLLFKTVFGNQNEKVMKYLIFDLNMEKTDEIRNHMFEKKIDPRYGSGPQYYITIPIEFIESVDNMFKVRDLNNKMQEDLNAEKPSQTQSKRPKI